MEQVAQGKYLWNKLRNGLKSLVTSKKFGQLLSSMLRGKCYKKKTEKSSVFMIIVCVCGQERSARAVAQVV